MLDRRTAIFGALAASISTLPMIAWGEDQLDTSKADIFRTDVRNNKNVDNFNVALFMARGSGPGHAYVAISEWQDESGGYWANSWIFGMYPEASTGQSLRTFFSDEGVPRGKEIDVVKDRKPDLIFVVYIDDNQLTALNAIRQKWRKYKYNGYKADCVSFMRDAAKSVGLKVSSRSVITLPVYSLKKIVDDNQTKDQNKLFLGDYPPNN